MSDRAVIGYHSRVVGEVAVEGVSGQRTADGGMLIFNVRLQFGPNEEKGTPVQLQNLTGTVQLHAPALWLGPVCMLNSVWTETAESGSDRGHLNPVVFLSNSSLRCIEEARQGLGSGAPMDFTLALRLHLHGPRHSYVSNAHLKPKLTQSDWIEVVRGMQWEHRVAIEIPVAGGRVGGALATAAEHMRRALDLQRQGMWVQTVAECRKVMEAARDAMGLTYQPHQEWSVRGQRESWRQAQRIEHVRQATHHLMHQANHHGVSDDPDAEQARLAVGLAGLMLRYYANRGSG